ncbi:MAG: peptidoglycan editing factor PgeF [Candidatus Krumholzibacteriia bacterium]
MHPGREKASQERIGPIRVWRPQLHDTSPWLHAVVTTRHGGCSRPPYDSLNLGLSTGDDPADVDANRALLLQHLSLESLRLHRLDQVHGNRVIEARELVSGHRADGLWTDEPGNVLVVGVADCVPVFVWDARRRRIALAHAGWRGTAAGIVGCTVDALRAAGSDCADLWMAMGPSIGPCCYEVGEEVAAHFPPGARAPRGRAVRVDLRQANRARAVERGVPEAQILPDPPCTACETATFYSHRRQGPRTGRIWALAWVRG